MGCLRGEASGGLTDAAHSPDRRRPTCVPSARPPTHLEARPQQQVDAVKVPVQRGVAPPAHGQPILAVDADHEHEGQRVVLLLRGREASSAEGMQQQTHTVPKLLEQARASSKHEPGTMHEQRSAAAAAARLQRGGQGALGKGEDGAEQVLVSALLAPHVPAEEVLVGRGVHEQARQRAEQHLRGGMRWWRRRAGVDHMRGRS